MLFQCSLEQGFPGLVVQCGWSTFSNIFGVLSEPSNNANGMSVTMSNGSVSFDNQALSSIAKQATGEEVTFSIEKIKMSSLTAPQQSALSLFPAVGACYELSISSGGSEVHDFDGGTARARLQYDIPDDLDHEDMEAILINADDDGEIEYMNSTFQRSYAEVFLSHFSVYAVVFVQPTVATKAARAALGALPAAGELTLAEAEAAVGQARELLEQVAALPDDQRAVVDSGLVANAEQVVERGTALIEEAAAKKAAADAKAAGKVKSKSFSVKAGKKKVIYFKTTSSSAGTRVTFKKASGSKYISVTKAGKVTAKKGMKKGKKYTAKVKVTCGATTRYVTITVRAR